MGAVLRERTGWRSVSRADDGIDFRDPASYAAFVSDAGVSEVINCIGHTKTLESDRQSHWDINYKGVADLVELCESHGKKLIHISTDYVYAGSVAGASEEDVPVHLPTWYTYTKLLSDAHIQLRSTNYLIFRCSYKETPFPFPNAWADLIGNFDTTETIADLMIQLIEKGATGVYNVGTGVKTIYELARESNPDVNAAWIAPGDLRPTNISMDVGKLRKKLSES